MQENGCQKFALRSSFYPGQYHSMATSSTRIPKPKDWQEFERQMEILAQVWLDDPNAKGNGRQGQRQNGVDVFGRRNASTSVGIQCKEKFDSAVTETELTAEVQKAGSFNPKLDEFILATTAPRDVKIQEVARVLSLSSSFSISVWGWEDIENIVAEHPRAHRAFDPTYFPIISEQLQDYSSKSDAQHAAVMEMLGRLQPTLAASRSEAISDTDNSTQLHGKISLIQGLIDDGDLTTARPLLDKIVREELDGATSRERYRIKVAQANVLIKQERFDEAGYILVEAATACPEHENATNNLAVGYLLSGQSDQAITIASELLEISPSDQKVADTLAQSRAQRGDDDPFVGIDPAMLKSSVLWSLRANLTRAKGDPSWKAIARDGVSEHPDDKFLRRFAAEAVVETCLDEAPWFLVGEAAKTVTSSELNEAARELYEQVDNLISIGGCVQSALAHNAALSCRLAGRTDDAKAMLDAGLVANPTEDYLVEQVALQALQEGSALRSVEMLETLDRSDHGDLTLATALIELDRFDSAKAVLAEHNDLPHTFSSQYQFLGTWFEIFRRQAQGAQAVCFFDELVARNPAQPLAHIFRAKVARMQGDTEGHRSFCEQACQAIEPACAFGANYEVADEAFRAGLFDWVVTLLSDRVAYDRESEALSLTIAAAMNGDMLKTASDLIDRVAGHLTDDRWFRRVKIALANKVGDPKVLTLVNRFIEDFPDDTDARLLRVGIWQARGETGKIRKEFEHIQFADLTGRPSSKMQIFRVATGYGVGIKAVPLAYKLLLANWEDMDCHLAYHSLFLSNDRVDGVPIAPQHISINCAFSLKSVNGCRRYRIESEKPATFGDEWLPEGDLLSKEFHGKCVGDVVQINGAHGEQTYEVEEIKSVYIDALHRSMQFFNERFPSSGAMFQMSIDPEAEDPFVEMKDMVRRMSERDEQILNYYRDHPLPIVWIASVLGKDEIECAIGIPAETGIPFRVCQGGGTERDSAFSLIRANDGKGVVVDTISAILIRRLGVYDAVQSICGPLHITTATIDRLSERLHEARGIVSRSGGNLSYREGKLVLTQYTQEQLQAASDVREEELNWARDNFKIVSALPRSELPQRTRDALEMIGQRGVAPVLAAHGTLMPLLADDFGSRVWAKETLEVESLWLQPVLMEARKVGILTGEAYAKTVLEMVDAGLSYVSLDAATLLLGLREANYDVARISKSIEMLCGKSADLTNNIPIAASLLNALDHEECPILTKERLAGEIARRACYPRWSQSQEILTAIASLMLQKRSLMREYFSQWLFWNSIGNR